MAGTTQFPTPYPRWSAAFARCVRAASFAPLLFAVLVLVAVPARADGQAERLADFAAKVPAAEMFPGADDYGAVEGAPPVMPIMRDGRRVGLLFLNAAFVNAGGYSGKPIEILVALDLQARIRGVKLVAHKEPIVLVGIPESRITEFIDGYIGRDIAAFARAPAVKRDIDIVSGATVTVMVIDDSILRAALAVARRYGLGGLAPHERDAAPRAVVATAPVEVRSWQELLGDGSLRRLRVSIAEINAAFAAGGDAKAARWPEKGPAEDDFIDLYVGLASVPTIGRSLLGPLEYRNLAKEIQAGRQVLIVAAAGRYSFKGSGYVRGGVFDRFQIIQGDRAIRFRDRQHKRLGAIEAAGAPRLKEVGLFFLPDDAVFDPAAPLRLELLVQRVTGARSRAYLTYNLGYQTPARYLKPVAPPPAEIAAASVGEAPAPLWQRLWREKLVEVVILVIALAVLSAAFFFQDTLTRRPKLADRFRLGFMIFTLFGIGFYANAQLSVVNVTTFFTALIGEFSWDYFLMEPLIFILWFAVAASLLFWGRGAYCGWLCPFGALQELLNRLARAIGVKQLRLPWGLHERLWPIKYIIFLGLFGSALYSLELSETLAEVEPFKTAIILKFFRELPFVAYALALLAAGLVIERFYCRYLCPLGAALAIPGRLRMFDWLKRYRQCGAPCQRCATDCMVGAIHPEGHINPNECLYCLNCQILYHDDQRCPVMVQRRLKRERRAALSTPASAGAAALDENGPDLADFIAQAAAGGDLRPKEKQDV